MEQLHSSVVIAKDTSSVTLFDSILPGALVSASAGEPPAPAPARGREAREARWVNPLNLKTELVDDAFKTSFTLNC